MSWNNCRKSNNMKLLTENLPDYNQEIEAVNQDGKLVCGIVEGMTSEGFYKIIDNNGTLHYCQLQQDYLPFY